MPKLYGILKSFPWLHMKMSDNIISDGKMSEFLISSSLEDLVRDSGLVWLTKVLEWVVTKY